MNALPPGWGFTDGVDVARVTATRPAPTPRHARSASGNRAQICFWLGSLHAVPSVDAIRAQWGVSRATAYRYRAFALSGGMSPLQPLQTNPDRPKRKSV